MATTILESDVIGSSFTKGVPDYSRTKSTRKFIVYNNVTPRTNMASFDDIIADMKAEDSGSNNATPLGPVYGNESGARIMHPIDTELPLQTVDVASLGADKFLVTAQYFVIPGQAGGAANIPGTMSLRAEYAAKSVDSVIVNGQPVSLPRPIVTTVQQLKIRLPFYTSRNPIRSTGGVLNFLGGRCARTTLGGVDFGEKAVRFDGVQVDELGGLGSDGANTYRFKGYYEFTARADRFEERIGGSIYTPTVERDNDGWVIGQFEF